MTVSDRRADTTAKGRGARRAAYAASAWAFAFAALSSYWAAGGTAFADTLGESVTRIALARDPGFVALLWGVAAAKTLLGLLALALAYLDHHALPRRPLLVAAWSAGVCMALYAGANVGVRALMVVGVLATPEAMHSAAAYWHLILWDPWWLAGGLLFIATAWSASRVRASGGGVAVADADVHRGAAVG